jgi:hypothetical protein
MEKRLKFQEFKVKYAFKLWNYNGINLPKFQQFNSQGVPLPLTKVKN